MEVAARKEHFADTGEEIEAFTIKTKRGYALGFFHNDTISIHHIGANPGQEHPVKGIMNTLCRRYNRKQFKFLIVVNAELKDTIKGRGGRLRGRSLMRSRGRFRLG